MPRSRRSRITMPLLTVLLLCGAAPMAQGATLILEDFEDVSDWHGVQAETVLVRSGSGAGRWPDVVDRTSISVDFDPPLDLSAYDHVGFWLHSAVANGQQLQVVFDSEDDVSPGSDYYSTTLTVDWEGWRWVWWPREALAPAREPLGWHTIQGISFHADGWSVTPLADTDLVFDQLIATNGVVQDVTTTQGWQGSDFEYSFDLHLQEPDGATLGVDVTCSAPADLGGNVSPAHVDLSADASAVIRVTVTLPAAVIAQGPYLQHEIAFEVVTSGGGREIWHTRVANPPPAQSPPRVLLTSEDFGRMTDWAANHAWAAGRRDNILSRADGWPADFLADYGLSGVALPPEGGQWGMHYVCPDHGVNLQYEPPMTHRCPVDNATYSGWPYDQVIYARQHNDLADAARDLGLAYGFTGDVAYAAAARQILLDYAAAYAGYPIHNSQGDPAESGARVLAQTLDESGWLIDIAWAYDLIASAGELSAAEQLQIEQDLIRASADTILRHDAGMSNWQAWHNAAIAAAGRSIGDPRLVAHAVYGPSGFHYHMAESVLADGFWYESSWGYHFYTLSPMTYLAEMGERGSFPLYPDPALQSMYLSPILFAPPDLVLPAFNDSGSVDLRGSAGWRLEAAYRAYGDEQLTLPLIGESRPEGALFWGAETLPETAPPVTESRVFEASGYAILRGGQEQDPWYVALDYGAHGGWHGHFDKLGFVFFARGRMFGLDIGSHSYALPLHDTWDRATLAHNTVTVDETVQVEATGTLEQFGAPAATGVAWARAAVSDANPTVHLARDLVLTDRYLIDRMTASATDAQPHQLDWLWHNPGTATHDLAAQPYADFPGDAGYQHLRNNQAEATADDGLFDFSFAADLTYPGGHWANDGNVVAEITYTDSDAQVGQWSGQHHYDFSAAAADAYITFRSRSLADYREEVPTAVAVWIRGDGSGNTFRLRIVDNTGESHVSQEATLDFGDWREIRYDVAGWSHHSGDDNGVIDLPLDNVVFQLNREAGGADVGDVLLDHWRLTFPLAGETVVEDYERLVANERVWVIGAPDTTFVVGEGIGPDLTTPVPYVMVRRQAVEADFHVLHEPYGAAGAQITGFASLPVGGGDAADAAAGYRIVGPDHTDHVLLAGRGAAATERSYGDHTFDGRFALVRATAQGTGLSRLVLAETALVADAQRDLFTAPTPLALVAFDITPPAVTITAVDGELENARLWAPGTERVTWQGEDVQFTREGEYVVFGALPDPEGDGKKGCGCATRGSGAPPLTLILLLLIGLWRRRNSKRAATAR